MCRLLTFSIVVLVVCALPNIVWAQSDEMRYQQCQKQVENLFPSRDGQRVKRAEMLRECSRSVYGNVPFYEEYWAHFIYIASEIDAGRMTAEQGAYLNTQKGNELRAKRDAAIREITNSIAEQQRQLEHWECYFYQRK